MAILIADNRLIGTDTHIVLGGDWEGAERLATDQLEPAAQCIAGDGAGFATVEVHADQEEIIAAHRAFCILGTTLWMLPYVIETWTESGGWSQATIESHDTLVFGIGKKRNIVIILKAITLAVRRVRLRWTFSEAQTAGALYLGRMVSNVDMADEGVGISFDDRSERARSDAGQIYTSAPSVERRVRIPQGSLGVLSALGWPAHGERVDLTPVSVVGDVSMDAPSGRFTVGSGQSGGIFFSANTPGLYRLDYDSWHGLDSNEAADSLRWSIDPTDWRVLSQASDALLLGRHALTVQSLSTSPLFLAASAGPGVSHFRPIALSKLDGEFQAWWLQGSNSSVAGVLQSHGSSRPIILIPHQSDPGRSYNTGVYGYITNSSEIREIGGLRYDATLTVTEAR